MKSRSLLNGLRIAAIVLLFIVSLNALAAGYSFIVEPSGKDVGITTDYLRPSAPFTNYLFPGMVLFVVIGVMSSLIAVLAIKKTSQYPLLVAMQGCVLAGWIAIQLLMVKAFHPLHGIIAAAGLLLILIGWILHINFPVFKKHLEM